jgi:protein-L-isoaspartate(D-aspartate) O-methyltransferase
VAELGTGSGYGAALASQVVSPSGSVSSIEIDETLARRATHLLSGYPNVKVASGDASEMLAWWKDFQRITITFAVDTIPNSWLDAIPEGGRMVAPVGREQGQRLMRIDRLGGELVWSDHGAVRYVRNRGGEPRLAEPHS